MSKIDLEKLDLRCPVCGSKLLIKETRKEGVLYGICRECWFRGFVPEEAVKKYKGINRNTKEGNIKRSNRKDVKGNKRVITEVGGIAITE